MTVAPVERRMRDLADLFAALDRSAFRRRFHLGPREQAYLAHSGLDAVMAHARQFIAERLAHTQPVTNQSING